MKAERGGPERVIENEGNNMNVEEGCCETQEREGGRT